MAETLPAYRMHEAALDYARIARMWIRASLAYPLSFALLTLSSLVMTALDFVGIWLMFHTVDHLGDFDLREIALLYGASGLGIGVADMLIGSVEQLGQHVRTGSLDTMLLRPVPLLVQVCADRFALRRLGRISQATVVFAWGAGIVDWTPGRILVALGMVAGAILLYFGLFVGFSCIQFWTQDATEFANAFTYGGNTITQYPLSIYPQAVVRSLTFVLPIAFVSWYPCLTLLGRTDPWGTPGWFGWLTLPVGVVCMAAAGALWRSGVRHYTSTGS